MWKNTCTKVKYKWTVHFYSNIYLPIVRTSHAKTPNDQTSLLEENLWSDIASGDIHIMGRNSPPL